MKNKILKIIVVFLLGFIIFLPSSYAESGNVIFNKTEVNPGDIVEMYIDLGIECSAYDLKIDINDESLIKNSEIVNTIGTGNTSRLYLVQVAPKEDRKVYPKDTRIATIQYIISDNITEDKDIIISVKGDIAGETSSDKNKLDTSAVLKVTVPKNNENNTEQEDEKQDNTEQEDEKQDNTEQDDQKQDNTEQEDEKQDNTEQEDQKQDNTEQNDQKQDNTEQDDQKQDNTEQEGQKQDNTEQEGQKQDDTEQDDQKQDNTEQDNQKQDNANQNEPQNDNNQQSNNQENKYNIINNNIKSKIDNTISKVKLPNTGLSIISSIVKIIVGILILQIIFICKHIKLKK